MDIPELLVWSNMLVEGDGGVKELLDMDELVEQINKAMRTDTLANNILRKLDNTNPPKGWTLMNVTLQF